MLFNSEYIGVWTGPISETSQPLMCDLTGHSRKGKQTSSFSSEKQFPSVAVSGKLGFVLEGI